MASSTSLEPAERVALVRQAMDLEASMPSITDPREVQVSIQAAILDAASDDDILAAGSASLASTEDFVDRAITITGFSLHKSRFGEADAGMPVYAVIDAITRDGVGVKFSCGSSTILTQLWALEQKTPFAKRKEGLQVSVGGKATASGNTVYFLKAA